MNRDPKDHLAVALDVPRLAEATIMARTLKGHVGWLKVATTLYTHTGPVVVERLKGLGFKVFLDLKFHDIPTQVYGACKSAAEMGVDLLTVHCSGGLDMLEAAFEGALEGSPDQNNPCRAVGVSVLTSLDEADLLAQNIQVSTKEQVQSLLKLAYQGGIGGAVCSPLETATVRPLTPADFWLVNPGIRLPSGKLGDQKRVAGPAEAIAAGADLLVVGRPIRQADNPAAAADLFVRAIEEGLKAR